MKAPVFDVIAREMGEASTRRTFVRFLGGVAAMGALAAVSHGESAEAKKGRKKRGKRKKQTPGQTCQGGTQVGAVSVPATGVAVNTPVLTQGQRYRLRASGFWNTNATDGNDAVAAFPFANPNAPVLTTDGVRVGLAVDGGSPDLWGSYTTTHLYEAR